MTKKEYKITQIPSLIDMHVHFREPGFEYKETIETGIASAKSGGFSGVCTMPNTMPVADNPSVIKEILTKAKKYKFEIYPIAAITKNLDSLELVDFKELKLAIECFGGEYTKQRDFSHDRAFNKLKRNNGDESERN